jgi:hypothetical protein
MKRSRLRPNRREDPDLERLALGGNQASGFVSRSSSRDSDDPETK